MRNRINRLYTCPTPKQTPAGLNEKYCHIQHNDVFHKTSVFYFYFHSSHRSVLREQKYKLWLLGAE
jgi:hypothetical protein